MASVIPSPTIGDQLRTVDAIMALLVLAGLGRTKRLREMTAQFVRDAADLDREDYAGAPGDDAGDDEAYPWAERLVFDPDVSYDSPVVRGTWVTAGQVVTLIVDGWSWSDILRTHPELTEDDIRACLSYTCERDAA